MSERIESGSGSMAATSSGEGWRDDNANEPSGVDVGGRFDQEGVSCRNPYSLAS